MGYEGYKKSAQELLDKAGIKINGDNPWDIKVHNKNFYKRVLSGGSLDLGESYMDGWWDCERLDQFFEKILKSNLDKAVWSARMIWHFVKSKAFNLQNISRSYEVGEKHYDLGNDLFELMLDDRMVYSCGYWKNAENLNKAQEQKLDLICRKLKLKKGMKVLDIGCGWGSFAKYAAENYGVEVVGITISKEQAKAIREKCKDLPVEVRLQDYREIDEKFDRVLSIGMFEHVGYKNYGAYMEAVDRCLKDDGLTLIHTIGKHDKEGGTDPWIEKYIFPNGVIPYAGKILESAGDHFVLEDWHNFGFYYDYTLMAWYENFVENWDKIKDKYGDRFYRMWVYYLLSCAGAFRSRKLQLWQIVFSKEGFKEVYEGVR